MINDIEFQKIQIANMQKTNIVSENIQSVLEKNIDYDKQMEIIKLTELFKKGFTFNIKNDFQQINFNIHFNTFTNPYKTDININAFNPLIMIESGSFNSNNGIIKDKISYNEILPLYITKDSIENKFIPIYNQSDRSKFDFNYIITNKTKNDPHITLIGNGFITYAENSEIMLLNGNIKIVMMNGGLFKKMTEFMHLEKVSTFEIKCFGDVRFEKDWLKIDDITSQTLTNTYMFSTDNPEIRLNAIKNMNPYYYDNMYYSESFSDSGNTYKTKIYYLFFGSKPTNSFFGNINKVSDLFVIYQK